MNNKNFAPKIHTLPPLCASEDNLILLTAILSSWEVYGKKHGCFVMLRHLIVNISGLTANLPLAHQRTVCYNLLYLFMRSWLTYWWVLSHLFDTMKARVLQLTCPELARNITFYILTIYIYIYFIIHFTIIIIITIIYWSMHLGCRWDCVYNVRKKRSVLLPLAIVVANNEMWCSVSYLGGIVDKLCWQEFINHLLYELTYGVWRAVLGELTALGTNAFKDY